MRRGREGEEGGREGEREADPARERARRAALATTVEVAPTVERDILAPRLNVGVGTVAAFGLPF